MTVQPPALRALVVEDDTAIREILGLHLGLAGFAVEDLADGRQALERIRQQRFDLLLLDVMLPGLDGVSLCRAARKEGANVDTPILMLTARDSESDTVVGLDSGADDYLTKPFGIRELQARISALMRRHQRSAGAVHGQEMTPARMEATIRSLGRTPRQRTTTYGDAPEERYRASFAPRPAAGEPLLAIRRSVPS